MTIVLAEFCTRTYTFYECHFQPAPTVSTTIPSCYFRRMASDCTVRTLRNIHRNPVLLVAADCYSIAISVEYLHHTWPSICPTGPKRSIRVLLQQAVRLYDTDKLFVKQTSLKKLFYYIPGQGGFEWQNISSVSRPTHTRPPNAGAGFPQVLFLTFTAEPQLCVHADQSDQLDHCPCTVQLVT